MGEQDGGEEGEEGVCWIGIDVMACLRSGVGLIRLYTIS